MSKKDIRRHGRTAYLGKVTISWEDTPGVPKYASGKCVDVSEGGMRIESPVRIAAYTNVSVRADQIKLVGSATIKHVERDGLKYILGLELSQALRDRTLSVIREAEISSK
ncbi:MAG TPA: PilZ domain-containing protein [Bryobacteraceae bacterium]|jgi:hypothetical protein